MKPTDVTPETLLERVVFAMRDLSIKQEKKKIVESIDDIVADVAKARWLPMKEQFEKSYLDYHSPVESTRASDDLSILYDASVLKEKSEALMEKSTTFETKGEPKIEEDFVAEIEESTFASTTLVDNPAYYQNYPRVSDCDMLDGNQIICDLDPAHSEDLIRRSIPTWKLQGIILELGLG